MNKGSSEKELLEAGYRKYSGEKVDVFFNLEICQHSGNCTKGYPEVFNIERKPWILADSGDAKEVARVIDNCHSGALKYIIKEK